MLDRMAHGTVHAVSALVTDVPARRRLDWRTPVRWVGPGRVGIAGHRTTYLHPFFNLDQVRPGDTIQLLTGFGTYRYAVTRNFVLPEATAGVVLRQTSRPTLVLTTCNPKYASSQRLIVEADLTRSPT